MKTSKILSIAMLGLALGACNDLDTEFNGGYASTEMKSELTEEDPGVLLYTATSLNSQLYLYQPAGTTSHEDFGYPSLMLIMDSRGIDLVSDCTLGFNWYSYCSELADASVNSYNNVFLWTYPYQSIYSANNLLATVDVNSDSPEIQFYAAQALVTRAFAYYELANMYQFTYKGHENAPCVPLLTDKNAEEVALNGGTPRATVQAVYDQIMSDLNQAVALLDASETTVKPSSLVSGKAKRFVTRAAAYGMRARVELTMNLWAEAEQDALQAIALSGAPLSMEEAKKPTNFWNLEDAHWIWGIAASTETGAGASNIVNWPSHMGSFCGDSYAETGAWRCINDQLYNTIAETDVRKGWWLDGNSVGVNLPEAWQDYVDEYEMSPYTQIKFGPYNNNLGETSKGQDILLMRVEEMYLIVAEARAMGGNPAGGAAYLTDFIKTYRDPEYFYSSANATEVQDEVWRQRRIELWGEGLSYFDIMRLKKPIDRRGTNWGKEVTYNVPAESPVMIYPIPQRETQANKFISDADNNPASPQPTPVQ